MAKLFTPFTIHSMTLKNRIVMSPMCMYSCANHDGKVMNWHKTHYTSRAVGQVGLIMLEATAVTPHGRISQLDLGIWSNEQVPGLKELVELVHEQGAKIGIQLAHAGRKAVLDGPIIAPSPIAYSDTYKQPQEMNDSHIQETIQAFTNAAVRAKKAGFDCIEIHAAHGYLINEFLSPLSNHRQDEYGGSLENRYRFLRQTIDSVKKVWDGPLLVRISANDYHPEGNTIDDYVEISKLMKKQGVHFIDCSSGGVAPVQIDAYPGYQVIYSEKIRREAKLPTSALGLITRAEHAEEILKNDRADLIFLARALLRDPYWPRTAAKALGVSIDPPTQYKRGWEY